MSRICDDPEILQVVAQTVLEEAPQVLEQLAEAVAGRDVPNIQLLAHRIKGTAKNQAAQNLADKAFALELAAKNNQVQNAQAMLDEIQKALSSLSEFLARPDWLRQVQSAAGK